MKEMVLPVLGLAGIGVVGFLGYQRWNPEQVREEFRKLGDVNRDGIIDDEDLALLQAAYGSTPGTPNWNPDCDLNGDSKVDIYDVVLAGRNYGLTMKKWIDTLPIFCLS